MKKLLCIPLLSMFGGLALAQPTAVPVCNGTNGPNCTDYFGVGNWANSPLPAGTITGFTLVAGGSGYVNPVVVITDPAGLGATGTATATAGVITAVTGGGGSGYAIPQVTIVDVGAGGALGAATCGGLGQPVCGSGAMATAVIGGPFTGGMQKFLDPLVDLKSVIATPDTTTFPGSDYYEIALVQYSQKLHSSLPATTLRGYVQLPSGSTACPASPAPKYLGPVIVATKNRPVRVKFTNCLAPGTGGNLFIPTDTTFMGAGMGPGGASYTENRATLHLHGGATPWISDGTPHQWTVPVGDPAPAAVQKGDSVAYVPDMYFLATGAVVPQCSATVTTNCSGGTAAQLPLGATNNPGQGSLTFYWTNEQGGRLMFYHDHAYGITRLNVYAGEAAGYLLVDPAEENALAAATAPGTVGATPDLTHLIPLVIQDKTFVPSFGQMSAQDPTWNLNFGKNAVSSLGPNGDLWFPHIYMPNQNPADPGGANGFGRWDYGPWFFPPQTNLTAASPTTAVTVACTSSAFPGQVLQPTAACPTCGCPITPNPSGTPEGFMDTPVVNGVAYPVLHVAPAAYRFQILAAGNDRSWNLSWFLADGTGKDVAMLPAVPPATGTAMPLCTAINPVAVPALGIGLATALLDGTGNPMNGTGLPGTSSTPCWPNYGPLAGIPAPQTMWAADGRAGGAPDPRNAGPPWIQIGTEGGLLPAPVVIPATPTNYEQNTRSITITSVAVHGLWLGPAERADAIVDFTAFSGKTLILYNDAPTPAPAFDSRLDYFTGDGDQSPIGGAPNTQPGYGPNTRTVMQVIVDQTAPNTTPFNLGTLKTAFASTATAPGLFAATQPTIIVPEAAYNSAYNSTFPNTYAGIAANNLTFTPIAPLTFDQAPCAATAPATCAVLDQKAIQELFTLDYGRMNATLGVEVPLTTFLTQTTIPLGYVDWPTEFIQAGQTQLWKITHNGVDTHFIHFHLFNVQVVNRMGWDGSLRPPDANEMGWKDTVRMNPLEDVLVALQPITPTFPFPLPDSIRLMDVTMPAGVADPAISGLDPTSGNATVTTVNNPVNFGWEYVWHCHILGHEENDMMRPIIFQVAPPAPSNLVAVGTTTGKYRVNLAWRDNSASETSWTIQRDANSGFTTTPAVLFTIPSTTTIPYGGTIAYSDTTATKGAAYYYRVQANDSFAPGSPNPAPFQALPLSSGWSNTAITSTGLTNPTVSFTGAPASAAYNTSFLVTATTNAGVAPTITSSNLLVCTVGAVSGTSPATATVKMTSGTGACTLTASWPATTSFNAATAIQTTTAALATPTVSFTGAPATALVSTTFTVTATTNAGVAPTMTGTTGICTVGTVSSPGFPSATATVTAGSTAGTCTLTATWAATPNYLGATSTQTTTVAPLTTPTVTFTGAPGSAVFGATFTVTATTNAGVAPTIAGTALVCTVGPVSGTSTATATVTMISGTGACTLTASWPAASSFSAATATQNTTAALATPTVSFTGAPATALVSTTFTVTATTNAGIAPTIASSNTSICTVGTASSPGFPSATATVTTVAAGTCTLTATWLATSNYLGATRTQSTSVVSTIAPTVTFTGAPASAVFGTSFTVTATTNAGIAPTITSSNSLICTVGPASSPGFPSATATITMMSGTGTCTLTASWLAAGSFTAATLSQTTLATKAATATRIISNLPQPSVVGQSVTVSVSVTGTGLPGPTGSVTVTASTGELCSPTTIPAPTGSCSLIFTTAGSRTLTASYGGDSNFNGSSSAAATQTVSDFSIGATPATQSINGGSTATYTLSLTSLSGFAGTVSLTCGLSPVQAGFSCSISPPSVTLSAGGTASATVTVNTARGFKGTYTLNFTGVSGTLTHTASATVTTRN